MTTTQEQYIPGYNIREDQALGYIVWYTLYQPDVTQEEVKQLIEDENLDKSLLPPPPRVVDAFKRACRYSQKRKIRLPDTDNVANLLIRSVAQTPDDIERHMVMEIANPEGRTLSYSDVVHLNFKRDNNNLDINKQPLGAYQDYEYIIDDRIEDFVRNFNYAVNYIDHQVFRRIIRDTFDRMNAMKVRDGGGVYFVPKDKYELLHGLSRVFTLFKNDSLLHSLPLLDSSDQRQMIRTAFESTVHEEAIRSMTELKQHLKDGTVPFKVWNEASQLSAELKRRKKEYEDLIGEQISKVEIELSSINKMLEKAAGQGLIE